MASSRKRKKNRTSSALAGTLSAFEQEEVQPNDSAAVRVIGSAATPSNETEDIVEALSEEGAIGEEAPSVKETLSSEETSSQPDKVEVESLNEVITSKEENNRINEAIQPNKDHLSAASDTPHKEPSPQPSNDLHSEADPILDQFDPNGEQVDDFTFPKLRDRISRFLTIGKKSNRFDNSPKIIRDWLRARVSEAAEREKAAASDQAALLNEFLADSDAWTTDELKSYCQALKDYCENLGFELPWLIQGRLTYKPLHEQLEAIVLDYVRNYQRAKQVHHLIEVHRLYLTWQQNLDYPQSKAFNHKLFIRLHKKGLLPTPVVEAYVASESTRWAYLKRALLKAAHQQTDEFFATFAEVHSS